MVEEVGGGGGGVAVVARARGSDGSDGGVRLAALSLAEGGGREVELGLGALEAERGGVVGARGVLGGVEGAEPHAGRFTGSRISAAHLPHGRCRTPRYRGRGSSSDDAGAGAVDGAAPDWCATGSIKLIKAEV